MGHGHQTVATRPTFRLPASCFAQFFVRSKSRDFMYQIELNRCIFGRRVESVGTLRVGIAVPTCMTSIMLRRSEVIDSSFNG